jgi:cytochrome c-type biogenesis protein CcmH/NrfG
VTGIPSLPAPTSLSAQELVALGFVEDGKSLLDQQDQEGARELFERAISVAPFQPYSYYFLGRIAFVRGDHKQAIAFLQKAELLFARAERAWLGETTSLKGTVYEDQQDYEHARASYRRSLRFEPANLKVLSALARLPEEEPLSSGSSSQ